MYKVYSYKRIWYFDLSVSLDWIGIKKVFNEHENENEMKEMKKNMKKYQEDKVDDICLVAAKSKWFKEKRIRPYVRLLALTGAVLEQRYENALEFCQELYLTLI